MKKWKFPLERFFHWLLEIWRGVILNSWIFLNAKNNICKYWTPIKIKIGMTSVYKEYEVMVQEDWLQLEMKFYWFITWKLLFSGEMNLWYEEQGFVNRIKE